MHRRRVLALLLVFAAGFAAFVLPRPIHANNNVGQYCAAVEILGSRGSGEQTYVDDGIGPPGKAVYDSLSKRLPGVGFPWANPYNAVGVFGFNLRVIANGVGAGTKLSGLGLGAYNASVVDGTKDLAQMVAAMHSTCPWTHLVLIGYSQGAQVTADAYQRDLTTAEQKMVAAIILFGDPYFNGGDRTVDRGSFSGRRDGLLGRRPAFSGPALVLSYCHSHDPICQGLFFRVGPTRTLDPGSLTFEQHKNYTSFGEPAAAAKVIADRLAPLLPRNATAAETAAMKAAVAAQGAGAPMVCGGGLVSRADPHFGWVVTSPTCGGSIYGDTWLKRTSLAANAPWTIIDVKGTGIATVPPCTKVAGVPSDIRCW